MFIKNRPFLKYIVVDICTEHRSVIFIICWYNWLNLATVLTEQKIISKHTTVESMWSPAVVTYNNKHVTCWVRISFLSNIESDTCKWLVVIIVKVHLDKSIFFTSPRYWTLLWIIHLLYEVLQEKACIGQNLQKEERHVSFSVWTTL